MRLVANGNVTVWPPAPQQYAPPPFPMAVTAVPIPRGETGSGRLTLACSRPPGLGGNGRTCEIAEVWLVVASGAATRDRHSPPTLPWR